MSENAKPNTGIFVVLIVIAVFLGLLTVTSISSGISGHSIFSFIFGSSPSENAGSSLALNGSNQTNQTHNECVNYRCVKVVGPGYNQCYSNNDCYNQTNQTNQTNPTNQTNWTQCYDTDGGIKPYTFGIVYAKGASYRDYCWNINGTNSTNSSVLNEYYCNYNNPAHILIYCPAGCRYGACLREIGNQTNMSATFDEVSGIRYE